MNHSLYMHIYTYIYIYIFYSNAYMHTPPQEFVHHRRKSRWRWQGRICLHRMLESGSWWSGPKRAQESWARKQEDAGGAEIHRGVDYSIIIHRCRTMLESWVRLVMIWPKKSRRELSSNIRKCWMCRHRGRGRCGTLLVWFMCMSQYFVGCLNQARDDLSQKEQKRVELKNKKMLEVQKSREGWIIDLGPCLYSMYTVYVCHGMYTWV